MVVNFTSNVALAKPTNVELAENWVNFTQLQGDNNTIIQDEANKVVTAYTPTFITQGTQPNIGSGGSVLGEYIDNMGVIMGSAIVTFFGSGIAAGTGEYGISLPFLVDNSFHSVGSALNSTPGSFSVIGEGFVYDASASSTSGSVAIDCVTFGGVSYARMLTEAFTSPAKTSRFVRDAMPITVAADDRFIINFLYKKL